MAGQDDETRYEMSTKNQETRHDKVCINQFLFNV